MKRSRRKKTVRAVKAGYWILIAAVAVVAAAGAVIQKNRQEIKRKEIVPVTAEGMIEVDGQTYIPKKNIESYLFMGIDDPKKAARKEEYDGTGQCDVLVLIVRDRSKGTFKTLTINRNTITDVKCLDMDGTVLATISNQISFAHAEGDGMEMSCENTCDAVSGLLQGAKIDGYAALNMGGIQIVNHMAGGVTVTIEDDFSKADSTMKLGETITLTDEQAETFVRGRMSVADGSNENRMKRQSAYFEAIRPQFAARCRERAAFPVDLYHALEDYMVTDVSPRIFSKVFVMVMNGKGEAELSIEGTDSIGELELVEFTPDPDSLQDVILDLFYEKYEP